MHFHFISSPKPSERGRTGILALFKWGNDQKADAKPASKDRWVTLGVDSGNQLEGERQYPLITFPEWLHVQLPALHPLTSFHDAAYLFKTAGNKGFGGCAPGGETTPGSQMCFGHCTRAGTWVTTHTIRLLHKGRSTHYLDEQTDMWTSTEMGRWTLRFYNLPSLSN